MVTDESNNTSCMKYGHLWISTTADNFRRCERTGCNIVQRLADGVWTSVSEKQEKKKKLGKSTKFVPGSLF